jgi:hypothetical protein
VIQTLADVTVFDACAPTTSQPHDGELSILMGGTTSWPSRIL